MICMLETIDNVLTNTSCANSFLCFINSWAKTCPAFLKSSAISSVAEKISSDLITSTFLLTAFEAANNPADSSSWATFGKFLSTLKSKIVRAIVLICTTMCSKATAFKYKDSASSTSSKGDHLA